MNLQLMVSTDEPNAVTKAPLLVKSWQGTLRDASNVVDPVIRLETDPTAQDITKCNYVYIPDFHRYYYIRDMRVFPNNVWELTLHVDVLNTYSQYIKAHNAKVSRRENASLYVPDNRIDLYANPYFQTLPFPQSFGTPEYLLTVVGT